MIIYLNQLLPLSFFQTLVAWSIIGIITLFVLLRIPAPYGRLKRGNWGYEMRSHWGWFCMEIPALVVFLLFIIISYIFSTFSNDADLLSSLIKALEKINSEWWLHSLQSIPGIAAVLWMIHYSYRSLLFPFLLNNKDKKIPVIIPLSGIFFNIINSTFNGIVIGDWLWLHHHSNSIPGNQSAFLMVIGIVCFIFGFIVHTISDQKLIALSKHTELNSNSKARYRIPKGFLFHYISAANYFGEIVQWFGFFLLTLSPAALSFLIWTIANLLPRALSLHQWYKQTFPEYPKKRKALIPFIL